MGSVRDWLTAVWQWIMTNPKKAIGAAIAAALAANSVMGWVPEETLMKYGTALTAATAAVLAYLAKSESSEASAKAHVADVKSDTAHDRLDRVEMAAGVLPDDVSRMAGGT